MWYQRETLRSLCLSLLQSCATPSQFCMAQLVCYLEVTTYFLIDHMVDSPSTKVTLNPILAQRIQNIEDRWLSQAKQHSVESIKTTESTGKRAGQKPSQRKKEPVQSIKTTNFAILRPSCNDFDTLKFLVPSTESQGKTEAISRAGDIKKE